jgi:hypothetical protein
MRASRVVCEIPSPGNWESIAELERFLALFGDRLSRGICQEEAFVEALRVYDGPLLFSLKRVEGRVLNGVPLEKALLALGLQAGSPEFRRVVMMASRLIGRGSKEAGERILHMVTRLRENRRLVEERESLIRATSFKVKVLTAGCSMSTALLTVLLPSFSALMNPRYALWPSVGVVLLDVSWTLAVALSVTCAISAYYAAEGSLADNPFTLSLLAAASYWLVFIVAAVLLLRAF